MQCANNIRPTLFTRLSLIFASLALKLTLTEISFHMYDYAIKKVSFVMLFAKHDGILVFLCVIIDSHLKSIDKTIKSSVLLCFKQKDSIFVILFK